MRLVQLPHHSIAFPSPKGASCESNGLLALDDDFNPAQLLMAYQHGTFPWFPPSDSILWWSSDSCVTFWSEKFHLSRSMKHLHKNSSYRVTPNYTLGQMIKGYANDRGEGTQITYDVVDAHHRLHELGHAHPTEMWRHNKLVGGIYGVA